MFNLAFASFNNSMNIILSSSVSVILRHFLIIDSSRHQESFSYSGLDLQALKKQFFFLQDCHRIGDENYDGPVCSDHHLYPVVFSWLL